MKKFSKALAVLIAIVVLVSAFPAVALATSELEPEALCTCTDGSTHGCEAEDCSHDAATCEACIAAAAEAAAAEAAAIEAAKACTCEGSHEAPCGNEYCLHDPETCEACNPVEPEPVEDPEEDLVVDSSDADDPLPPEGPEEEMSAAAEVPTQFTVTYNLNGGTAGTGSVLPTDSGKYVAGQTINIRYTDAIKSGNVLTHWVTKSGTILAPYATYAINPADADENGVITFTGAYETALGKFSLKYIIGTRKNPIHSVTFYYNNGNDIAIADKYLFAEYGYVVSHWIGQQGAEDAIPGEVITVTGNEYVYVAKAETLEKAKWTVKFVAKDGVFGDGRDEVSFPDIPHDTAWGQAGITVPTPLDTATSKFVGWYVDVDYAPDAPPDNSSTLAILSNITYTAVFEKIVPTTADVTFVAGAGGSLNAGDQTVFENILIDTPWDEAVTVPGYTPDDGYEFVRWEPEFPGTVTESKTYKAIFEIKKYTVNFSAGEGGALNFENGSAPSYPSIDHGTLWSDAKIIVPTPVPDENHYFDKWSPVLPAGDPKITSDLEYVATFKEKTTIEIDPNKPDPGKPEEEDIPDPDAPGYDPDKNGLFLSGNGWKVYGAEDPELKMVLDLSEHGYGNVTVPLTHTASGNVDAIVGTYNVEMVGGEAALKALNAKYPEYKFTFTTGNFRILPRPVTFEIPKDSGWYNGGELVTRDPDLPVNYDPAQKFGLRTNGETVVDRYTPKTIEAARNALGTTTYGPGETSGAGTDAANYENVPIAITDIGGGYVTSNYKITLVEGSWTLKPLRDGWGGVFAGKEGPYTGKPYAIETPVSFVGEETPPEDTITVLYQVTPEGEAPSGWLEWDDAVKFMTRTDVGTTTVEWKATTTAPGYTPKGGTVYITVNRVKVFITIGDGSKDYSGDSTTDPSPLTNDNSKPAFAVSGKPDDGVAVQYNDDPEDLVREAGEDVRATPYWINFSEDDLDALNDPDLNLNPNYIVEVIKGNFTINKKDITIDPADYLLTDAQTKVYGDADPAFEFTVTLSNGTEVEVTLTRELGEANENEVVGSYDLIMDADTLEKLNSDPNCTYSFNGDDKFTITRKPVDLAAIAQDKPYDGTPDPLEPLSATTSPESFVGGPFDGQPITLVYELTRAKPDNANVGEYDILYVGTKDDLDSANPNYDIDYTSAIFEITQKEVIITPGSYSKTFGDDDLAYDDQYPVTITGAGADEAALREALELARTDADAADGEDAKAHTTIEVTNQGAVEGAFTNYDIEFRPGTLTIIQKAITIDPEALALTGNNEKIYGEDDPSLVIEVPLVGTDSVTVQLKREEGEDVAIYALSLADGYSEAELEAANPNYTFSFEPGVFTINKRPVTFLINNATAWQREDGNAVERTLLITDISTEYGLWTANGDAYAPGSIDAQRTDVGTTYYGDSDEGLILAGDDLFIEQLITISNPGRPGETLNDNYEIEIIEGWLRVNALDGDWGGILEPITKEYTGAAFPIGAIEYKFAEGVEPIVPNVQYRTTEVAPEDRTAADWSEPTSEIPERTNVGTTYIEWTASYEGFETRTGFSSITVTRADVTIQIGNGSKEFGITDPDKLTEDFTVTVPDSLVDGADPVEYEKAVERLDKNEDAGDYAITFVQRKVDLDKDNPNYNITVIPGNFKITQKPITIDPEALGLTGSDEKVYGEEDPDFTLEVALNGTDTVTVKLEREEGEDVNTYPLSLAEGYSEDELEAANPNYTFTFKPGNFTITHRPLVLQPAKIETVYTAFEQGGTTTGYLDITTAAPGGLVERWNHTADTSATVVKNERNVKVYEDYVAFDTVENVADITIYEGTKNVTANYEITTDTNDFEITKATLTLTAGSQSIAFGEARRALAYSYRVGTNGTRNQLLGGDKLIGTLKMEPETEKYYADVTLKCSYKTGDASGNYPITFGYTYYADNYDVVTKNGNLAVGAPGVVIVPEEDDPIIPVVPVDPVDPPEEPEPPVIEELIPDVTPETDADDPIAEEITDEVVPQAQLGAWALLNLIVAVLALVFAVMLVITAFKRNKNKEETEEEQKARMEAQMAAGKDPEDVERNKKAGLLWRIISIIAGILAPIVFLLTENLRLPMIFTDRWTLLMVIILVVQVISMLLMKRARNQEEDKNDEEQVAQT